MLLRRIALGLAVTALVVVAALVLVAAVLERPASPDAGPEHREEQPGAGAAPVSRPMSRPGSRAVVPRGWVRVAVGEVAYAVPAAWSRRPAGEQVAYREDGAVIASGRGQALSSVHGCSMAWAVVADSVRSSNPAGVAEATALAWARGYAGLPEGAPLRASPAGEDAPAEEDAAGGGQAARSRVVVDLGDGPGCGGERAELTAVARQVGAEVVALVVARYLNVRGAPSDAAYEGVLGSLTAE